MKRKISAIIAADVVGYSRLVSLDEETAISRLMRCRYHFRIVIERSGGRIFNTAGDAILAEFPSSVDALRAAIEILEGIRSLNRGYTPTQRMKFRIGMTVGDVIEKDGDLFGDAVNVAARLEGLAEPGGICLSAASHDQVCKQVSIKFNDLGFKKLKNIPDAVHAYGIHFLDEADQAKISSKKDFARRRKATSVILAVAGFSATLIALTLLFDGQDLDPSFFQGDFAVPKANAEAPPTTAIAARESPAPLSSEFPRAPVDHAGSSQGGSIPVQSGGGSITPPTVQSPPSHPDKQKDSALSLCINFSTALSMPQFAAATIDAEKYLSNLKMRRAGFSTVIATHEAAKELGYGQDFASLYGELIGEYRQQSPRSGSAIVESTLGELIREHKDIARVSGIERYKPAIVYYLQLISGSCSFPNTVSRIPPTGREMIDMLPAKDLQLSFSDEGVMTFTQFYDRAVSYAEQEMAAKGTYSIFDVMNLWRHLIIEDGKKLHYI